MKVPVPVETTPRTPGNIFPDISNVHLLLTLYHTHSDRFILPHSQASLIPRPPQAFIACSIIPQAIKAWEALERGYSPI